MRILHVYRTYYPDTVGGIEEVIKQICVNTQNHGIESRIFCLSPNPKPAILDQFEGQIHRSKKSFEIASCGFSFSAYKKFQDLVEWADIINYHFPWPFADVLHLTCKKKKPTLVTYHSDIVRQQKLLKLYSPVMHRFFDRVGHIVAASPNYFATSSTLERYSDKVSVIPYGLDPSTYSPPTQKQLQRVYERHGDGYFLFIGTLRYYKGLHILLEAIKNTDLSVVIAGAGPTEEDLRKQAKALQLDNVHFVGAVDHDEKAALIKHSRGIVFPSHLRSEAFGVALLEGAMFGKPLISCEIGTGTSYVNKHDETGLVIPPSDTKSLREAMQLLSKDKSLALKMGKNAKKRYQRLFTGDVMGKAYADLYQQMAG